MNNEDNNSHDPTLLTFLFCLDWQTLSGKNWFTEQLTHLSLNLTKMSSWSSFLFLTHFMYDLDLMYLPPFPSTQFSYWSVWVFTVIFFLSLHTCSYTLWPLGGSSVQLKQLIYLEPCCPPPPPPPPPPPTLKWSAFITSALEVLLHFKQIYTALSGVNTVWPCVSIQYMRGRVGIHFSGHVVFVGVAGSYEACLSSRGLHLYSPWLPFLLRLQIGSYGYNLPTSSTRNTCWRPYFTNKPRTLLIFLFFSFFPFFSFTSTLWQYMTFFMLHLLLQLQSTHDVCCSRRYASLVCMLAVCWVNGLAGWTR